MPKKEEALEELNRRWRFIFSTLEGGGEVPPSLRLRTEGIMESLVLLELATEMELQEAMETCYRDCYREGLPADWRALFPFPQVPGFGQRAPVYPSTSD